MLMTNGTKYILSTGAALAVALAAAPTFAITDGFGDGDRNNNGSITLYDVDTDLSGVIDNAEPGVAENASDTGLIWHATRGFTSGGDPKANIKVIDDSAGLGSGYALGVEGKGSGSSFAGFLDNPVALGANVGDRVDVSFDFRIWEDSSNATPLQAISELRWGIFQDTDSQFGQTNDGGFGGANVVWGNDTGENDAEWRGDDPGPVGDKGYWMRMPVGTIAPADAGRLVYERNKDKFLEGSSVGCDPCGSGDQDTVADPGNVGEGPGGAINDNGNYNIGLSMVRTATSIELQGFLDGVLIMIDEIDPADLDVIHLGTPHDSIDYIAFRNTGTFGDFDYVIDNVSIQAIPEPASLALMGLGGLMLAKRRR